MTLPGKHYTRRNEGFVCEQCGATVEPGTRGVLRNHCPQCLFSQHVDVQPGDRKATCGGLMRPVQAYYLSQRTVLVHECTRCRTRRENRAALAPCAEPDNLELILKLMKNAAESVRD